MSVIFDEWRADFVDPEGDVVIPDVLWIRATKGDVMYHMPAFEENDRYIADMKLLLMRQVNHHD